MKTMHFAREWGGITSRGKNERRRLKASALGLILGGVLSLGPIAPGLADDQPLWFRLLVTAEYDSTGGMATDGAGNVIVTGRTLGSLMGTNLGSGDAWVALYNPRGRLLWGHQFGTSEDDSGRAVGTDADGNVLIAGLTEGALGGHHHLGGTDTFLVKYDPAGQLLWEQQFGTSENEGFAGMAVDGGGNIVIAGLTEGALGGHHPLGGTDAFLVKYDPAGRRLWERQLGTSENDGVAGMAVDGGGNVIIAGYTNSFNGPSWLAKFDPEGRRLWRQRLGGAARGVATDGAGNIVVGTNDWLVAAWFTKFDPDGRRLWKRQLGESALETAIDGADNVVVLSGPLLAKYSGEGELLWTTRLSNNPEGGTALATDADGNIVLTYRLIGSGSCNEGYTRKHDADGQFLWERFRGFTVAAGVATDLNGDVLIAGLKSPLLAGGGECGKQTNAFVAKYAGD